MVALPRCLSSLALLACIAAGARVAKKRRQSRDMKFIADVPVLNYHAAYAGESLVVGAEEEWVVGLNAGVTDAQIEELCAIAHNGCKLSGKPSEGGVPFFEMRGTESDLEAIIKTSKGAVKYIEPDQIVTAIPELEADDQENNLWGLERIGAYQRASQGNGVTVFILDTGVRTTHRDFRPRGRGIPTLDFSSGSLVECDGALSCAKDNQGHGTHCAGTAVGQQHGVAPAATVRSVKVLTDQGSGQYSWTVSALDWLARSSIRPAIASMSLGGPGTQQIVREAVDAATSAGVTVVVAAGNSKTDACQFSPAFVPSAITVGSTTSRDARSSFSNYGSCTNIWAPGSSILSAGHNNNTDTATMSGTSMACPHVAGGAALVLERNPGYNYAQVLETMQNDAAAEVITGLRAEDTNRLLYVGEGGAPPSPTVVPTPAPPPCPKICEVWIMCGQPECPVGVCCR